MNLRAASLSTSIRVEPEVPAAQAMLPDWSSAIITATFGRLMALADSVGAWCAFLHLGKGASTTTIESKTNFLRGVRGGSVEAIARPLHAGRTVIVVDTELRDGDGKLVARVTQTQAVLPARTEASLSIA